MVGIRLLFKHPWRWAPISFCSRDESCGAAPEGGPRHEPWVSSEGGRHRVAAKENRVVVTVLSPLTGFGCYHLFPHGWHRGPPSLAAWRLSSSALAKADLRPPAVPRPGRHWRCRISG